MKIYLLSPKKPKQNKMKCIIRRMKLKNEELQLSWDGIGAYFEVFEDMNLIQFKYRPTQIQDQLKDDQRYSDEKFCRLGTKAVPRPHKTPKMSTTTNSFAKEPVTVKKNNKIGRTY